MIIYIDADACPVKSEIVQIASKLDIPVVMLMDVSHIYEDGYSQVIIVDQGKDAVDMALVNKAQKGDIIVTQDYGVATMSLAKGAFAINQNGRIYSEENIDRLLFERHIAQKQRRAKEKGPKHKKRSKNDNSLFLDQFEKLCLKAKQKAFFSS